jgi:L-threonylcarbamoyladenylate synthase
MIVPTTDPASIAQCAAIVRAGGLIGLPTETVYGLAADACNPAAVAQIFAAKGRPADHPLIVHLAAFDGGVSGLEYFAQDIPAFARKLMAAFWPGPLTLIVPRRPDIAAAAAGGQSSIGLRCPAHQVAQALLGVLRQAPNPVWGLAAPSANRFGRVSPTTAQHVQNEFGDQFVILDAGACAVGIESTIVDCTRGVPVLLRPGAIGAAEIDAVCGVTVAEPLRQPAPRASGTLASHYAPDARVSLWPAQDLAAAVIQWCRGVEEQSVRDVSHAPRRLAVYATVPLPFARPEVLYRRMPEDAVQVAYELFAVLRELDACGVQEIMVQAPPAESAWDGVRDRLQRASVK